ncbi:hypothetical protein BC781_101576 [Sediminitomix flava]|uniref:Uncharacterized protein n=2 Tax=Sediminitomix flava TaxID=379075 RepID=A0A315ZF64_SEDFL|nr:hypothetical protein BC781_101576 [Sediminitomix flava]
MKKIIVKDTSNIVLILFIMFVSPILFGFGLNMIGAPIKLSVILSLLLFCVVTIIGIMFIRKDESRYLLKADSTGIYLDQREVIKWNQIRRFSTVQTELVYQPNNPTAIRIDWLVIHFKNGTEVRVNLGGTVAVPSRLIKQLESLKNDV